MRAGLVVWYIGGVDVGCVDVGGVVVDVVSVTVDVSAGCAACRGGLLAIDGWDRTIKSRHDCIR